MIGEPNEILKANVERLMEKHGIESGRALALRAGVDPKTVNRMLSRPLEANWTLGTIDKVAVELGVAAWQLCMPNMPMDEKSHRVLRAGIPEKAYKLAAALSVSPKETADAILTFASFSLSKAKDRAAQAFSDLIRP